MPRPTEPVPAIGGATLHLTFDDGPDATWTPRVLEALEDAGARATFFVLGDAVRRSPDLIGRAIDAGHGVGLHADRHVRHTELAPAEIAADADAALAALAAVGVEPRWWRTPWGVVTAATRTAAAERGLELVGWHADTHDWRGDAAGEMLDVVRRDAGTGGVVLAHDGLGPGATRTGCEETVALIAPLAAWAARAGLVLEPLSGPGTATVRTASRRTAVPVGATTTHAAGAGR